MLCFFCRCGSGAQTRSRELTQPESCIAKWAEYEFPEFQCPHSGQEERPCNEGCPNGGEPSATGCSCPDGWGGTCCNISKLQFGFVEKLGVRGICRYNFTDLFKVAEAVNSVWITVGKCLHKKPFEFIESF